MTRILIARHGQSEWNALGRWQGQADPPLSDLGRLQASSAARQLVSVEAIISSPLQRAHETAGILAERLGITSIHIDDDLRERAVGEWSGLTNEEIEQQWPGYLDQGHRPPGYEPDDVFVPRALGALARIQQNFDGRRVVVVAHGGLIYALEHHHGAPFTRIKNLGGRWFIRTGEHLELGERVDLVDDGTVSAPTAL